MAKSFINGCEYSGTTSFNLPMNLSNNNKNSNLKVEISLDFHPAALVRIGHNYSVGEYELLVLDKPVVRLLSLSILSAILSYV